MKLGLVLSILAALAAPLGAQGGGGGAGAQDGYARIELRLVATRPGGLVVIDRGETDGLAVEDRVLFYPLAGAARVGLVRQMDDRSALVELLQREPVMPAGTRGEVLVPRARLAAREAAREAEERARAEARARAQAEGEVELPPVVQRHDPKSSDSHDPWENEDRDWKPGKPLLAQVDVLRPEERPLRVTERVYVISDRTWASLDDRSDSFDRAGTDVTAENLFGRGGELHFDGEVNQRTTDVPGQVAEDEGHLRVDRLSYRSGGTRFEWTGWEAGRFLQRGLPQFGILDGYEWITRTDEGHRFGASAGFKPEPSPDQQSGKDFQIAAFYRWVSDETERFSAAAGYQKTWHNGVPDRDLVVLDAHLLPLDGWSYQGTLWIDFFTGGDDLEGSGIGLTQAFVSANRRLEDGTDVVLTYSHYSFPELLAKEFQPVTPEQIADDANDRVSASAWRPYEDLGRVHGRVGLWADEDEKGGDVELGLTVDDLWQDTGSTDLTFFFTDGQFEFLGGGRLSHGWYDPQGRWDFSYEFINHSRDGFSANNDDINQHWLRAAREFRAFGFDCSLSGDVRLWNNEESFSIGFFAQRIH